MSALDIDKKHFTIKAKQQIIVYKELIMQIERAKYIIPQFDGKQYNKRLITALTCGGDNGSVSSSGSDIKIMVSQSLRSYRGGDYVDYDDVRISISLNADWTIRAASTCDNCDARINVIQKHIKEWQSCIENYDANVAKTKNICNMINEYYKSVPTPMALRFNQTGVKCYVDKAF